MHGVCAGCRKDWSLCDCLRPLGAPPVSPPASAGPEPMPEGWYAVYKRFADTEPWKWEHRTGGWIDLNGIRGLLATQGLHIVDAASAKVLEACAVVSDESLCYHLQHPVWSMFGAMCRAELARRAGRGAK